MKRTKPGSQPTRIMPRRGNKRQNSVSNTDAAEDSETQPPPEDNKRQKIRKRVIAEDSSSPESQLEAEASPSSSAPSSSNNHQKRTKLDKITTTGSKFSLMSEAPASSDGNSNRKSPDLNCSICLCAVENRAFTNACYHTFCFECLVEWSHVRAVCPLCKKPFHSIIHSFRSYDDYELYQVPKSYVSNSVNVSSPNDVAPSSFARVGRLRRSRVNLAAVSPVNDFDHMLALRRRVYSHSDEMQLRGLWSSDGVVIAPHHPVSPAMFDFYPVMLERVRPWVLRDIAIIIGAGDVAGIADIVLGLLRNFPITSEDFYERLFPYLGLHTRRFLQELDAFARSPFDMTTYDARVVYSTTTNLESFLRTDHVEDISSSDDSDIEIVSPAVVSTSEDPLTNVVGSMTDHVVPDLLRYLRTFQHNLLMSLSFMNQQNYPSGLESPVPGPSGLGRAVGTDESESAGSYASRSADGVEGRSNSPMVLSDADSDIVVVDVDRPVRSPIHISSGEEDDGAAQRVRARRRAKRERRRARTHGQHRSELQQNDSEVPQADVTLPHAPRSPEYLVDCDIEDLMHALEQGDSSTHVQDQPSSHDSIRLNDDSSSTALVSPSKPEAGMPSNTARHHHPHPKRSKSANSVTTMSFTSSADDVNPLPCKKHVRGHKSSKQKARDVLTENNSTDIVYTDNAEKPVSDDPMETTVGSHDLPDTGNSEQSLADVQSEVAVPSVGESSFCSNPPPVSSETGEGTLAAVCQLDCEIPVPSTSEMSSPLADLSSSSGLDNAESQSFFTAKVTFDITDECLPVADENPLQYDRAGSSLCNAVQISLLDADENAPCVVNNAGNTDDCDPETRMDLVPSSDPDVQAGNIDSSDSVAEPLHSESVPSDFADPVITRCQSSSTDLPSLSNPCLTLKDNDRSSETLCSVSISTTSSTSSFSQLHMAAVESSKWESRDADESDNRPLPNDYDDSMPGVGRENDGVVFANSSSIEGSHFDKDATAAANSNNWSSLPTDVHELFSSSCPLIDYLLKDRPQSLTSPGLVIDENPSNQADLDTNDTVAIPSPVGIESSDSEVEWLDSGVPGRQRCISISSGGSSVICNSSDTDDVDSLLSDSDSLEIFDDEPPALKSEDHTDKSRRSSQRSSPQNNTSLPSLSDVSSVDENETADAVASKQVVLEPRTPQLEDLTAKSRHSYPAQPTSSQSSALLPSTDAASSMDVSETKPAITSDQVTLESQTSEFEDQTVKSRHPSSPQNSALLPVSTDMAAVNSSETESELVTSEFNDQQANCEMQLFSSQNSASTNAASSVDINDMERAITSVPVFR